MRILLSMIAAVFLISAPAKADFLFASNVYGNPVKPSGNFSSWSPSKQSNCAQPGTTSGGTGCEPRNHSLDAGRAADRAAAAAEAAAKANGASDAEAAAAGAAAGEVGRNSAGG